MARKDRKTRDGQKKKHQAGHLKLKRSVPAATAVSVAPVGSWRPRPLPLAVVVCASGPPLPLSELQERFVEQLGGEAAGG